MAEEGLPGPLSGEREHAVSLGLWQWIVVLWRAACITFGLIFKVVKANFGGSKENFTLYEYIVYEGMRDYQSGLGAVAIQNLLPSTADVCAKAAKKQRIAHTKIRLRDGTIVVRLGIGGKERCVVHFHGGGYMAPALPQHAHFACGFAESLPDNTSIFILQYALASEKANHYPRQLQQAVTLMEHLLHSEGIPPPAITLIGDSAGAHLALSLLLHLRYPNPRVSPVSMEGALSGAVLVSPWVMDMSSASDSMTANRRKDVLKTSALKYWARNFMGNATPDYWTSLLTVPAKWWADLLVDDILVIYGHDEVLRDDISELCEKITAGHGKATAINFLGEIHGHMLLNRFLRINKPCASERALRSWLDSRPSG